MKKSKLWLGLTGVTVFLLTVLLALTVMAGRFEQLINDFLGLTTSGLQLKGSAYADENGNLTDTGYERLIEDSMQFCIDEEEQGSVLLTNKNNALPLKSDERKVTLFGNNSAHIIYRSSAGGPTPNDEYVIDMEKAFKDGGFTSIRRCMTFTRTLVNSTARKDGRT